MPVPGGPVSRELGIKLCELVGLDSLKVASLTLELRADTRAELTAKIFLDLEDVEPAKALFEEIRFQIIEDDDDE